MISRLVWKSPYITKPYGRTCRSQNRPYFTPKINSFAFLHKKNYQIIINQPLLACKSIKLIVLLR